MKIIDLRLRNLNSLTGDWSIDFSHPGFRESGLFAITGPTGVGKTSLLDAICLALYGVTPRLDKVNKSVNEIMTKGRGECLAELTFETPAGRWRCHWSQHRARKKADGELQEPRHEISEAASGRILESARGKTPAKVEEIIGMSFQQFTRSIMLAQGAFAAFLEARPDQRADLLEQITGAEIYSEISKKVHEKRELERRKLNEFNDRLKMLGAPAEGDEDLLAEKAAASARLVELEKSAAETNRNLLWRKNLAAQEAAAEKLAEEARSLDKREESFRANLQRLEAAKLAAGLASVYERLNFSRGNATKIQAELEKRQTRLPAVETALSKAEAEEAEAGKILAAARRAEAEARPLLNRVRLLDHSLSENSGQREPLEKKLRHLWDFPAQWGRGEAPAFRDFEALERAISSFKAELDKLSQAQAARQGALEEMLAGRDLPFWREKFHLGRSRAEGLASLAEDLDSAGEAARELKLSQTRRLEIQKDLENTKKLLELESRQAAELDKQAEFLADNLNLLNRLKSLEERRAQLVDGQPCDLCGSTSHPYARPGRLPRPDVNREMLENNKKERQEKQVLLNGLKSRESAGLQRQAALEAGVEKTNADLERLKVRIDNRRAAMGLEADGEGLGDLVKAERARLKAELGSLEARLKAAESLERELAAFDSEIKSGNQQFERLQGLVQEARSFEGQLKDLEERSRGLASERRELLGRTKPEEEEKRLAEALEKAEKNSAAALERKREFLTELEKLKASLAEGQTALKAGQEELQEAEKVFTQALAKTGLADEAAFTAARLPEEERSALEKTALDFGRERAGLEARLKDNGRSLAELRQLNLSPRSQAELEAELAGLGREQRELQDRLAVAGQKLEDRRRAAEAQRELTAAAEKQSLECRRWDRLHELIGSADGKKYRNFAQGLSFEIMIAQANRQLARLSDRYILIRDPARPLELNVADNYQAGEIRSTKNLSGGESFIVSLALALGLSQMASRRVRVDSLFLDEGFGTLDEEALDLALDTLSALHDDGKLIGVISHIPAMMNRIPTQIEIRRLSGPHSLISGPGVARLDAC